MIDEFYRLLFDSDQSTCFSNDLKNTKVEPVRPRTDRMYFTLNALDPKIDHHPRESYHATTRPRRADHNVVCLRNILIEMDHGKLSDQLKWMQATQLPFSSCVSSGGKSLHFIISLQEPVGDRFTYSLLVKRLYDSLAQDLKIDAANKNPSRFSRCPGAKRRETGKTQELVALNMRVANAELERWIEKHAPPTLFPRDREARVISLPTPNKIFSSTQNFLQSGAPRGEWNNQLFRAACNLFQNGVSFDEATEKFRSITGSLDSSDLSTIRSAFRRVESDI